MAGETIIRRVLSAIPWRKLTYDEARALALKGEHLVEREGQLVGAPRGVGEEGLAALRGKLDKAAFEGRSNAPWYSEARAANTEMSGGDPDLATKLAAGQAIYSPKTPPQDALGYTLSQLNRSIVEGPEQAGEYTYRMRPQARKFREVLQGEDPETTLGPKTGPYFQQMNPADEATHAVGVNDDWMGRLYGYNRKNAGFSQSEHSFMTGENLLARDRADLAGIFPKGTEEGVQPWQAAAWAGMRKEMLRAKYPNASEAELDRMANSSVKDAMDAFTWGETAEQVPSRASEHLAGAADLDLPQKEELTRLLAPEGAADPYYAALGMAQRPRTQGLGQFTESVPDNGPLRFQPAFRLGNEVKATTGYHDMGQLPEQWATHPDLQEGFIDQHGAYYTRQQAANAVREAEAREAAAQLPSRRPMRNKVGEEIPYLGSAERGPYEQQYLKNVRGLRGEDKTYVEETIPLDLLDMMHGEPQDKLRTQLYARGYREGAPPNRILVVPQENGTYRVLDGNRRVIARRLSGGKDIEALVERDLTPEGLTSERLTTRETHYGQPQTRTDYNPNITARPMVSYAKGSTAHPRLGEPEEEMLRGVNTLRSAVDVQAAGAGHVVKPTATPSLQNAATVVFPERLENELTAILYEQAQGAGLSLIDRGGGTFTLTGDFGQMRAGEFKKRAAALLSDLSANGAKVRLGHYVGMYNEMPAYGEGRVTEHLLEQLTPRVGEKLDTPELRSHWLKKNRAEKGVAAKMGLGPPRKDVQKLRSILAKGGPEGLRAHVLKYGTAGLPGLAAFFTGRDRDE